MRVGHGEMVICEGSHVIMTPCMRCVLAGGWHLDGFMWKPRIEFNCSNVVKPESAKSVGSTEP